MPIDEGSIAVTRDVTFRETPDGPLGLDLYRPTGNGDRNGNGTGAGTDGDDGTKPEDVGHPGRPAVVFVYGGAWVGGRPGQWARWSLAFADRGYVCVEPTYRLADTVTLREMVTDVKAAVAWVREHADALGVDPGRVAVAGHSAGAHLALLAALAPDEEETTPEGFDARPAVAAAVGVSGSYDLRGRDRDGPDATPDVDLVGGTGEERRRRLAAVSPVTRVDPGAPPTFLAHGRDDEVVPVSTTEQLADALRAADVPLETYLPEGADHVFLHSAWWIDDVMGRTRSFLDTHL